MTSVDQQAGFMEAICEDPHDLGIREIYADWLDDHGETERAEFVHVQCELAGMDNSCLMDGKCETTGRVECRWHALRRRERELETHNNVKLWLGLSGSQLLGMAGGPNMWGFLLDGQDTHFTFYRGFVEQVSCTCAVWLKHGPEIVQVQPVLEVKLTDVRAEQVDRDPGFNPWRCPIAEFCDRYYPTPEAACAAAMRVALAWARREAGLLPLREAP